MESKVRRNDLLYPDLSFKVSGILFEVFKEVGPGYQEKYYQRAIALALAKNGIKFQAQLVVPLIYAGETIGKYILDFLI